jgi:hypothetical protein
MNEDLISNNFADNVNRLIIKRNVRLSQIGLFLCVTYAVVLSIDWYLIVQKLNTDFSHFLNLYLYFIWPIILFVLVLLSIYGILLTLRANKKILLSFENSDAEIFNEAYLAFAKASLLSIICFMISILSVIIRIFLN